MRSNAVPVQTKTLARVRNKPDAAVAVLLLGNYRPALAIARALDAAGYRIVLGLEGEELGAECSRYVSEIWDHPATTEGPVAFLAALDNLLGARPDIIAAIPVSEEFMLWLMPHEEAIKSRIVYASPNSATVKLFSEKLGALDFASQVGVTTLPYSKVSDHKSLIREAKKIGYPLTVRAFGATARLGHKKALIFKDEAELRADFPDWPENHTSLLLQRFALGDRHNLYFAANGGKITGLVQSKILKTDHPDGTGLAVKGVTIVPDPALVDQTSRLVAATHYTGIGLAQFIVDPVNGQSCFLELNPRISGSHAVPEQVGLPLARIAVELALAKHAGHTAKIADTQHKTQTGIRYAWLSGDVLALKHALMRHEITYRQAIRGMFGALRSGFKADIHMVGSWRDPAPAILAILTFLPGLGWVRRNFRNYFVLNRVILIVEQAKSEQRASVVRTPASSPSFAHNAQYKGIQS